MNDNCDVCGCKVVIGLVVHVKETTICESCCLIIESTPSTYINNSKEDLPENN